MGDRALALVFLWRAHLPNDRGKNKGDGKAFRPDWSGYRPALLRRPLLRLIDLQLLPIHDDLLPDLIRLFDVPFATCLLGVSLLTLEGFRFSRHHNSLLHT